MFEALALSAISLDPRARARATIHEIIVAEYAARMHEGVIFPPILVVRDPETGELRLADGWHRHAAAQRAGLTTLLAEIREGTLAVAQWLAAGANRVNGKTMTLADKTRSCALCLESAPESTQHVVAEQVGCAESLVWKVKRRIRSATGGELAPLLGRALVSQQKRAQIRALVEAGASTKEIVERLKAHTTMIADERRKLGVGRRTTVKAGQPIDPALLARILQQLRANVPMRSICATEHVSEHVIRRVRDSLPQAPSVKDRSRKGRRERLEKITQLAAEGYTSRQIAATVEVTRDHLHELTKRHGIEVKADRVVGHTRHHDPNRIIEHIVMSATSLTAGSELIDYAKIDASQLEEWITELKQAQQEFAAFIRRLVQEHAYVQTVAASPRSSEAVQGTTGAHSHDADSRADAARVPAGARQ